MSHEYILLCLTALFNVTLSEGRKCTRYNHETENLQCKDIKTCKIVEECEKENNLCYTMYEKGPDSSLKPSISGCKYHTSDTPGCETSSLHSSQCVLEHFHANLFICCCSGEECNKNLNFTLIEKHLKFQPAESESAEKKSPENNLVPLLIPIGLLCLVFLAGLLIFSTRRLFKKRKNSTDSFKDFQPYPTVEKGALIYNGDLSKVWKGQCQDQAVAIKLFSPHGLDAWHTEKDLFTNYRLRHSNILRVISVDIRPEKGCVQHTLITEYAEYGSLYDYLRNIMDLDINLMLQLMLSVIKGVAYLHKEGYTSVPKKPIIAHRDLKSQNIMMKSDGRTCCIGDFGLAVAFCEEGSKGYLEANTQVGTRRYMSPEILQGAISYHVEAVIHSDIYSMSLVLWELLSRCNLTQVGSFMLPYETSVGKNPSISQMYRCVVDQCVRPELKDEWREHEKLSVVCDTMEDCWDKDSDARLSAECLIMRFTSLLEADADVEEDEKKDIKIDIVELENDFSNEMSSLLNGDDYCPRKLLKTLNNDTSIDSTLSDNTVSSTISTDEDTSTSGDEVTKKLPVKDIQIDIEELNKEFDNEKSLLLNSVKNSTECLGTLNNDNSIDSTFSDSTISTDEDTSTSSDGNEINVIDLAEFDRSMLVVDDVKANVNYEKTKNIHVKEISRSK